MLTIEKYVLPSPEQWEIIIEGARNPMNSWDRMDSGLGCTYRKWNGGMCEEDWLMMCKDCGHTYDSHCVCSGTPEYQLGPNDYALLHDKLSAGGPVHAKYRRMIPVYVTINAPLYWWKEFDTYKVGTVCNSCSTMHKIHAKEFELSDFSTEHLEDFDNIPYSSMALYEPEFLRTMDCIINMLNTARTLYLETKDTDKVLAKKYWWQMIQLLPTSYMQKRTIFLTYEVLGQMRYWRRNHKLDEWHTFVDWIDSLPYQELMDGAKTDE